MYRPSVVRDMTMCATIYRPIISSTALGMPRFEPRPSHMNESGKRLTDSPPVSLYGEHGGDKHHRQRDDERGNAEARDHSTGEQSRLAQTAIPPSEQSHEGGRAGRFGPAGKPFDQQHRAHRTWPRDQAGQPTDRSPR